MTSERYEKRHRKLQFLTGDKEKIQEHFKECPDEPIPNEYLGKCFSYFIKKDRGQKFDIDGTIFTPYEDDFIIEMKTRDAVDKLQDKIFTKKLTKGKRRTLRKDFIDIPEHQAYSWISLMNYLRQMFVDGEEKVLLSRKEYAILQPKETKKQKLRRETRKIGVMY